MFVLKVEEAPDLWPEDTVRAATPVICDDHVEPVQWHPLNVPNIGVGDRVQPAARGPRQRRHSVP